MPVFALGLEFDMRMAGITCGESRTDPDKMVQCQLEAVRRFDYDWALVFPDDYIEFEPLGLTMNVDADRPTMPRAYLTMDRQTLSNFQIPDARTQMRLPIHLEMVRRVKQALGDTVLVVGRIAAPFSTLGLIYGIEALLIGLEDEPALIHDNMKFFVDHQIAFGRAQFEAGADMLWLGDCLADSRFISPEQYEAFAFDVAAEVASALNQAGFVVYHSSETSLPHLGLQTQLPVNAVNVGPRISIAAIKEKLGVDKCLMGNLDAMLLRDGTCEEIAEATRRMIEENLPGGGYVFNTDEGVMQSTPPENVDAMMRSARATATALGSSTETR